MDFFFDTSLIFLALVVVLIVTAITGIILVRDVARFTLRRKRERAAEIAERQGTPGAAGASPVPAEVPVLARPEEKGETPHA